MLRITSSVGKIAIKFWYSLWNARTNTEGYNIHNSEWEFIVKYYGLILLNLVLPTYHGPIVILQNRRLFRSATVSWHYRYSQIAVYFGLPEYHGIISLQIAVYFGLPMYHGIIGISVSPFISVLPKYHGIGIHPISSNISLLSHTTLRLSIMATQLFQFLNLRLIFILARWAER